MSKVRDKAHDPEDLQRVRALHHLKILDTKREERFDRIVREMAQDLDAPMAYVSLIDRDRQWLKSELGGVAIEIGREESFCNHTIEQDRPLVVSDARQDERFARLPFVTGDSSVRFYAGVPIADEAGHRIGTVCVADRASRELDPEGLALLEDYARKVQDEMRAPPTIFISYAHEDEAWKDRLVTHCRVLERQGLLDVWEDRRIGAGEEWRSDIRDAMERAKVAVLLISANFLTSDFILNEEIPRLLQRRDGEGLHVIPIVLKPCNWNYVEWLAELNVKPRDGKPVSSWEEHGIEGVLTDLAGEIGATVQRLGRVLPSPAAQAPTPMPSPTPPVAAGSGLEASASATDRCGETLGSYELLDLLSDGATGKLYRALDTRLHRQVTIKLLPPNLHTEPEHRVRFETEARIIASLRHPGIPVLLSMDEAGTPFLVFDSSGETLAQRLGESALPVDDALRMACDLASALAAAHERGVIHRSLDPADLVIDPSGRILLLGFGVAKLLAPEESAAAMTVQLSMDSMLTGTSTYASPERLRGQAVDRPADVFSFASVFWAMLTGASPFASQSPVDELAGIVLKEPNWDALPPHTPPAVSALLRRCLEKEPGDRFRHMGEVYQELANSAGTRS